MNDNTEVSLFMVAFFGSPLPLLEGYELPNPDVPLHPYAESIRVFLRSLTDYDLGTILGLGNH